MAQSIGGGGGNGGFSGAFSFSDASAAVAASVGGLPARAAALVLSMSARFRIITPRVISRTAFWHSRSAAAAAMVACRSVSRPAASSPVLSASAALVAVAVNAGAVTVNSTGRFLTEGTQSNGIVAQSIGGGGGNGGGSLSGSFTIGEAGISASLGGFGGAGGKAGAVVVNSNAGRRSTAPRSRPRGRAPMVSSRSRSAAAAAMAASPAASQLRSIRRPRLLSALAARAVLVTPATTSP